MLDEDRYFCLVFLQCEGNMKDVERIMGISYPTIKNRLARIVKVLDFAGGDDPPHEEPLPGPEGRGEKGRKKVPGREAGKILDALDRGEIDFDRALERLRAGKPGE
jgi:hypothetical protein